MLQRAVMCAGKEMWTVEAVICQVKRPHEELYNASARDGTSPCYVSSGSAKAAAIERHSGRETGVLWAETVNYQIDFWKSKHIVKKGEGWTDQ